MSGTERGDASMALWAANLIADLEPRGLARPWPRQQREDLWTSPVIGHSAEGDGAEERRGWGPRPHGEAAHGRREADAACQSLKAREGSTLASVIEGDVIPRLVRAHRHGRSAGVMIAEGVFGRLGREDGPDGEGSPVETFTRCILRGDQDRALAVVRDLEARGVSFEALCEELLEPTAAFLGAYCTSDACDFSDLTVALGRLQWILHELERDFGQDEAIHGVGHRVLLGAVPAEKHTFGVSLVSAVFHRAGWDVTDALVTGSKSVLLRLVSEDAYPVIGLCVCRSCQVSGLPALIDEIRRASLNPCARVLLIGPPCGGSPEDLAHVGADGLAETALAAIEKAEELLADALEQD